MTADKVENGSLRPVTAADAGLLFEWTNEAETRKNSFSSEPVLWDNHVRWLDKKIADNGCLFFIMLLGEEPVGTVRLDIDAKKQTGLISYSIDKRFRGQGLGSRMLVLAEEKAKAAGLRYLVGEIKPENRASEKCFLKNGYEEAEETATERVYRKSI